MAEIERLTVNGYREIMLTGIHLGHYGIEWNRGKPKADWLRLSHLLARSCGCRVSFVFDSPASRPRKSRAS